MFFNEYPVFIESIFLYHWGFFLALLLQITWLNMCGSFLDFIFCSTDICGMLVSLFYFIILEVVLIPQPNIILKENLCLIYSLALVAFICVLFVLTFFICFLFLLSKMLPPKGLCAWFFLYIIVCIKEDAKYPPLTKWL